METIKRKMLVVFLTITLFYSCLPTFEDTLRCKEIVSSKGEKIYIKSLLTDKT